MPDRSAARRVALLALTLLAGAPAAAQTDAPPAAIPEARFENVEYISGRAGFEKKQKGELLVGADSVTLLKDDGTFGFSIPTAHITSVGREKDIRDGSVGKKLLFGSLAGSRKQEFVQVTTESETEAEGIVFKVKQGTSVGIASKIAFAAKKKRGAANVATPAPAEGD